MGLKKSSSIFEVVIALILFLFVLSFGLYGFSNLTKGQCYTKAYNTLAKISEGKNEIVLGDCINFAIIIPKQNINLLDSSVADRFLCPETDSNKNPLPDGGTYIIIYPRVEKGLKNFAKKSAEKNVAHALIDELSNKQPVCFFKKIKTQISTPGKYYYILRGPDKGNVKNYCLFVDCVGSKDINGKCLKNIYNINVVVGGC